MRFEERSFVDQKGFRPSPVIKVIDDPWTLIVVSSWGRSEAAQLTLEKIAEKILEPIDMDATRVASIPSEEPIPSVRFREGLLSAQAALLENENKSEWQSVVEVAICQIENDWLYWAQVGCPHLLLSSPRGYEPISLSQDFQNLQVKRSPLPFEVLGLESLTSLKMGMVPFTRDSQLLLLSSNQVPQSLFSHPNQNLLQISDHIIQDEAAGAGWLGLLTTS